MNIDNQIGKEASIAIALRYAQIDGGHHKMWVIDQMLRALTGCTGEDGEVESEEYKILIKEYCKGEDGNNTYEWDTGIAP